MVDKFSIINRIDLTKLDEEIDKFKMRNGYNPYIFMSFKTMEEINNVTGANLNCFIMIINKYKGLKVFEDDELDFGKIELR